MTLGQTLKRELTVCGSTTYSLIRNLVAPEKPVDVAYADLVAKVKQHLSPTPSVIAGCRRKQGGRNQGSSQLTVWQRLTRVECKRTSRTMNTKKGDKIPATIKTSGEGRKGTDQSKHSQHFRALLLRRCGCGLAYRRMWVWFCAHAHKNNTK